MTIPPIDLARRLDQAQELVQQHPEDWKSWEALYVAWAKIGDVTAAWIALQRCLSLAPPTTTIHARSIRFLLGTRDYGAALSAVETYTRDHPESMDFLQMGLESGLALGASDRVEAWANDLVERFPEQTSRAAHALARVGRMDRAQALIETRLEEAPGDARCWAIRAEIQLWANQVQEAAAGAQHALTLTPGLPLAALVQAACQLKSGDAEGARIQLEALVTQKSNPKEASALLDPSTPLCWLSLAHHTLGDTKRAIRIADRARNAPGPQSLPAHLLRMKMVTLQQMAHAAARRRHRPGFELDPLKRVNDIWSFREILERIEPLLDAPERPWSGVQGELQRALDQALSRLGGNLTPYSSRLADDGGLPHRYSPPPSPRAEARQLQHLLRTRPLDEVLERFRHLQALHPHAVTPYTYMGETLLWFGHTTAARTQLQSAVDRDITTQWAWIGLGACELLDGRPLQAIETFQKGIEMCRFEGPTMFVYRAQCWLELGDFDRARADIDAALYAKPQRLSAWLLRAHLDLEMEKPALAQTLLKALSRHAPHFWRAMTADSRTEDEALRMGLQLMRGNRSSALPFFVPEGTETPAFLRWKRSDGAPLQKVIAPLTAPQPHRWVEERPTDCRRGTCGPRCVGREKLQAWIGPAAGIQRWIHHSDAPESLRNHALEHLIQIQAQRRHDCPDLKSLAAAASALVAEIQQDSSEIPGMAELCAQLTAQTDRVS